MSGGRFRFVTGLVCLGTCFGTVVISGPAQAAVPAPSVARVLGSAWSVTLPSPGQPAVSPVGVIASSCRASTSPPPAAVQSLTTSGHLIWSASDSAGDGGECAELVVDASGNSYRTVENSLGAESLESRGASGIVRWRVGPIAGGAPIRPALGWNGSVYVVLNDNAFNGRPLEIRGFNRSSGAQTLQLDPGGFTVSNLFAFADGLIVVGDNAVQYFSYNGTLRAIYTSSKMVAGVSSSFGPGGVVFLAGGDPGCSASVVEKYGPTGLVWRWEGTCGASLPAATVAATPDGGAIIGGELSGREVYTSLDAHGKVRWSHSAALPVGAYETPQYLTSDAAVGANGVVMLPVSYAYLCGPVNEYCNAIRFDFVWQAVNAPALSSLSIVDTPPGSYELDGFATGVGHLYVTLHSFDMSVSTLATFAVAGLAADYQRIVGLGSAPPASVAYVALGDSYSSGEGTGVGTGAAYDPGTAVANNKCHRSSLYSWPALVARSRNLSSFSFHACSGAIVQDFSSGPNHEYSGEVHAQDVWVNKNVSLVTLTVGGDDADFEPIMSCFSYPHASSCEADWQATLNADLTALSSASGAKSLLALYLKIKQLAPGARVVVVGYPRLFPAVPTENSCPTGAPVTKFSTYDQRWLNTGATRLDSVIKAAALKANVTFVDVYNSLNGHELCQSAAPVWLTRATPSDSQESFHPNSLGNAAIARVVKAAV